MAEKLEVVQGMISNAVAINIVDAPKDAPHYGEEFTLIKLQNAIIVGKGTIAGKPTVDLQLVDAKGNRFVVMATGAIIESIAAVIAGKRQREYN